MCSMRKTKALLAAVVAIGGVFAGITPASASLSAPEDTGQGKLTWSSCNDATTPALQCAMLEVPLDYAHPNSTKIKIKVNRLPATAPKDKQQGPILLNPG